MRRIGFLALASCLAWTFSAAGAARPDDQPPAASSPLAAKETAARTKASEEMAGLAKFCAMYSAYDDARQAYARAIALAPAGGGDALKAEVEKLKDRTAAAPAA